MRYKLYYLKQELDFFIKQVGEIEKLRSDIHSLSRNNETEERAIKLIEKYKKKAKNTVKEISVFERCIDEIPDDEVRKMAKNHFMDLMSYEDIGRIYYLDRTSVYKKIKRYIKI